jgi:integrase
MHTQDRPKLGSELGDADDRNAREASACFVATTAMPTGAHNGLVNHRPTEDLMPSTTLVDIAGRRRSAPTVPGYHHGRPPRNKGLQYPADPPTVEEIIAVMRSAGAGPDGVRLRALIVVLWRAGLRIGEAFTLTETDLDARRGAVLVRHGKGDKRREVRS